MLDLFDPPETPPAERKTGTEETEFTREGSLLHLLMERLTESAVWPVQIPAIRIVAQWLGCTMEQATVVCEQAKQILTSKPHSKVHLLIRFGAAHRSKALQVVIHLEKCSQNH
jgi:hypothetical protein